MLDGIRMSETDKAFLISAGLPDSAAPFLGLLRPEVGMLPTYSEYAGLPDTFRGYRVIGHNGSGDAICIDEGGDGTIVSLNHDDHYRRVFMNSSIPQLAESLLVYRSMVRQSIQANGEDAFLDHNIPVEIRAWLRRELRRIDAAALDDGCVWQQEVTDLDISYLGT